MARDAVGWVILTLIIGCAILSTSISSIWWLPRGSKSPLGNLEDGSICSKDTECSSSQCLTTCCNKWAGSGCKACDSFGRCSECTGNDYNLTYNGCVPTKCTIDYLCN